MRVNQTALERTFWDRALGFFSPLAELRRLQARQARDVMLRSNGYEGASHGRRTQNWYANGLAANALVWGNVKTLRSRCRDLERNQPYAASGLEVITTHTVGKGIIPTATGGKRDSKNLDSLWVDWGDETACDFDGRFDFYGLQALAMKTIARDGSVLIRRKRARLSDGLPVPLQLQVLEPDYLDFSRDCMTEDGGRIMNGVAFDKNGRRTGYWLFPEHPGDRFVAYRSLLSEFVPASEVLHVYRTERAGQSDGVPWLAPGVIRIKDLDEYEDAALIRQKIAACFVGFIHDTEALDDLSGSADKKSALERVEPGILETLPPGKTVTFGTPPATQGHGENMTWYLRGIAAALGITYEALTGDYSQVNFSSARMGALRMRANIDQWQGMMLVPQLCKPVWRWFVEAAIMQGTVETFSPAVWTPPRREMIDPVKETEALKAQIRIGLTPLSEAQQQLGKDPVTVMAQYAADNQKLDELKLKFDSDPRKDTGAAPTNDTIHP